MIDLIQHNFFEACKMDQLKMSSKHFLLQRRHLTVSVFVVNL